MELKRIIDAKGKILDEIVELEKEAYRGRGNVDLWILKALIRYGLVYILIEDDEVVGIIEYMKLYDENSVFLYGMAIKEKYRNMGLATKMLVETEKILKKDGVLEIKLTVDPKNEIACGIYQRAGYDVVELNLDEYGKGIDRYTMLKSLKINPY